MSPRGPLQGTIYSRSVTSFPSLGVKLGLLSVSGSILFGSNCCVSVDMPSFTDHNGDSGPDIEGRQKVFNFAVTLPFPSSDCSSNNFPRFCSRIR